LLAGNIVAAVVIADTSSEREPTAAAVLVAYAYIVVASSVAELGDYKLHRL